MSASKAAFIGVPQVWITAATEFIVQQKKTKYQNRKDKKTVESKQMQKSEL